MIYTRQFLAVLLIFCAQLVYGSTLPRRCYDILAPVSSSEFKKYLLQLESFNGAAQNLETDQMNEDFFKEHPTLVQEMVRAMLTQDSVAFASGNMMSGDLPGKFSSANVDRIFVHISPDSIVRQFSNLPRNQALFRMKLREALRSAKLKSETQGPLSRENMSSDKVLVITHPDFENQEKLGELLRSSELFRDIPRYVLASPEYPLFSDMLEQQATAVEYSRSGELYENISASEIHMMGGFVGACFASTFNHLLNQFINDPHRTTLTLIFHTQFMYDSLPIKETLQSYLALNSLDSLTRSSNYQNAFKSVKTVKEKHSSGWQVTHRFRGNTPQTERKLLDIKVIGQF